MKMEAWTGVGFYRRTSTRAARSFVAFKLLLYSDSRILTLSLCACKAG